MCAGGACDVCSLLMRAVWLLLAPLFWMRLPCAQQQAVILPVYVQRRTAACLLLTAHSNAVSCI